MAGLGVQRPHRLDAGHDHVHLITIPGPPPKGRSSTDRCLSVAQSRILCNATSTNPRLDRPLQQALTQVTRKNLGEKGQHVETHGGLLAGAVSAEGDVAVGRGRVGCRSFRPPSDAAGRRGAGRFGSPIAGPSVQGRLLLLHVRAAGAVLLDQHLHLVAGQGAHAQPVLDPLRVELSPGVGLREPSDRRFPVPPARGRRGARGCPWRRCDRTAGDSGPSFSFEYVLPLGSPREHSVVKNTCLVRPGP